MNTIYKLSLKPLNRQDDDSIRIYNTTQEAVDRLNNYLLDFVNSIGILKETLTVSEGSGNAELHSQTEEKISYMENKVESLCNEMERIAEEMREFVEVQEIISYKN